MPGPGIGQGDGPGRFQLFPSGPPTIRAGLVWGSSNAALHQAERKGLELDDPGISGQTFGLTHDIFAINLGGRSVNGEQTQRFRFVTSGDVGVNLLHTQPDDDHGDKIANPPTFVQGRFGGAAGFQYDRVGGLHLALEGTSGVNVSHCTSGYVGGRLSIGSNFGDSFKAPGASLFVQVDHGVVGEIRGNTLASLGLAIKL